MIKSFINRAVAEGSRLLARVKSSPKRLIALVALATIFLPGFAGTKYTFNCAVYSSPMAPKITEHKDITITFVTETLITLECGKVYNLYGVEEAGKLGSPDNLYYDERVGTYGYVVAYRVKPEVCTLDEGCIAPTLICHTTITDRYGKILREAFSFQYATGDDTLYCNKIQF